MAKVKFGDVIKEYKGKINQKNNPYEFYVAGDHMDTDDLTIRKRGCFATDDVGPAFIREFKKGQVLYGSRRTYLRKIAVADFDGVTANTTFVLETKNENILRQRLIPFIMNTEKFTEWSIKKSKGSTNPYVLFKDLAEYVFELPDIGKQDSLAELLWCMNDTKDAYNNLIASIDDLVKSQFIEMFSEEKGWPLVKLKELCDSIVRGPFGSTLKVSFFVEKNEDTVKVYEQKNAIQKSAELGDSYVTKKKANELTRFTCGPGDFIMSCSGTIGCLYQLPESAEHGIINQALCKFHLNGKMLPEVFLSYMRNSVDQLETNGSAIKNIGAVSFIKNMEIALPPIPEQEHFAEFIRQSDKSKFELRKALAEITALSKRIMQENLA